MTATDIEARIAKIVELAAPADAADPPWESKTHLKIARLVMEEFAIELSIDEIIEMNDKAAIAALVRSKRA